MPSPAPHPGLSQKSPALGGGIVQSAEVVHGSPRPPALPPVLELLPLPALLDPLAVLLLVALAVLVVPVPLLLDALAPPAPPAPLLLDALPPLPDDEVVEVGGAPPADDDEVPVAFGPLSPHPRRSADMPARTETSARREAKRGTRGMVAIVPPPPDRLART